MCVAAYLLYFTWKNHLSETTILEKQKRKLEIIKLALEIEVLRKQNPSTETTLANEPVNNIFKATQEQKSSEGLATFKSIAKHPLNWIASVLTQRPKWLRYFFAGGFSSSVYPLGISCYTLLHLPANTSAESLHLLAVILLVYLVVSVFLSAILVAIFNLDDIGFALLSGLAMGFVAFQLCAMIFGIFLHLRLVFLNAH